MRTVEKSPIIYGITEDLWNTPECDKVATLLPSGVVKSFEVHEFVFALQGQGKSKIRYRAGELSEEEERRALVLASFTRVAPSLARVVEREVEYAGRSKSDFLPLGKRVICVPLALESPALFASKEPVFKPETYFI